MPGVHVTCGTFAASRGGMAEPMKSDVLSAREEVERARADFVERLSVATRTGKEFLQSALHGARPLVIAAAAVGVVTIAVGLVQLGRMRTRTVRWQPPARSPSLLGSMVRSALISAAASLAGRLVQHLPILPASTPRESSAPSSWDGPGSGPAGRARPF